MSYSNDEQEQLKPLNQTDDKSPDSDNNQDIDENEPLNADNVDIDNDNDENDENQSQKSKSHSFIDVNDQHSPSQPSTDYMIIDIDDTNNDTNDNNDDIDDKSKDANANLLPNSNVMDDNGKPNDIQQNILIDDNDDKDDIIRKQSILSESESNLSGIPQPSVPYSHNKINGIISGSIICTFVPKNQSGPELTVIAGDTVNILHSESILSVYDNPLANNNNDNNNNIILKSIHWTKILIKRNNKIGIIPSNILKYDSNPINNVWTKVKISFSYTAKSMNQLSVSTGERLQIYGCVKNDGMITAKRKNGNQGLIPFNFVDIPSAEQHIRSNSGNNLQNTGSYKATNNSLPVVISSSLINNNNNRNSVSSNDSLSDNIHNNNNNNAHHTPQQNSQQLNFLIDVGVTSDTLLNINDTLSHSKNKLTSKIAAISSTISTAIDKIQHQGAYSVKSNNNNPTLDIITSTSYNSSPSINMTSALSNTNTNDDVYDNNNNNNSAYQWNAPLKWRKLYVLRDFNGTQDEIDNIYNSYILEKQSRGRVESILNYEDENNNNNKPGGDNDVDMYNVAAPSFAKKTMHDVIKFKISDILEVCGDPSPEGWILARFCNNKDYKGFVPISYFQQINVNKSDKSDKKTSGIGAALEKHQLNNNNNDNQLGTSEELSAQKDDIALHNNDIDIDIDNNNTPHITPKNNNNNNINIRSTQLLPFHWPFSSYNILHRSFTSKLIETIILLILLIIYLLPVIVEEPIPSSSPSNYHIWFVNLFGAFLPWFFIVLLRMLELWKNQLFNINNNPNNKLWASFLFHLILFINFIGLFTVVIELGQHIKWIQNHSKLLFLTCIVQLLVFIFIMIILIILIIFVILWTFCCRITKNRWEIRIHFYCCTKGDPIKTKRISRTKD